MVRGLGVKLDVAVYILGVVLLSLIGFFSPWWWSGFLPLGLGCLWAYYDMIDVEEPQHGNTPRTPR